MKATMFLICIGLCALSPGGCSRWHRTNPDAAISRAWAPAEFFPPTPEPTPHDQTDPGPATRSLDRSDWALTVITAHNAQPQHQPIYT